MDWLDCYSFDEDHNQNTERPLPDDLWQKCPFSIGGPWVERFRYFDWDLAIKEIGSGLYGPNFQDCEVQHLFAITN